MLSVSLIAGFCVLLVVAPIFHSVQRRRSHLYGKIRWPLVFLLSPRTPMLIVGTTRQVLCASQTKKKKIQCKYVVDYCKAKLSPQHKKSCAGQVCGESYCWTYWQLLQLHHRVVIKNEWEIFIYFFVQKPSFTLKYPLLALRFVLFQLSACLHLDILLLPCARDSTLAVALRLLLFICEISALRSLLCSWIFRVTALSKSTNQQESRCSVVLWNYPSTYINQVNLSLGLIFILML